MAEQRKRRGLTQKQRALVRNLAEGRNLTQSALAAGYSGKCPGQACWQALESIRLKLPELLDQHGLTDQALIEKHLKRLLGANENEAFSAQRQSHRFPPRASQCHQAESAGHGISFEGLLCKASRRYTREKNCPGPSG